jgi:hypothetical protein
MDIINLTIKYVLEFAAKAEADYNVNPWIFCILFFGSAIPLYYGYYRIGRSALKFEDRKLKRKEIDKKELKIGLTFSIIAWWLPYVYVIIFGRLPIEIWLVFYGFVAIMAVFFAKTLKQKISDAKKVE